VHGEPTSFAGLLATALAGTQSVIVGYAPICNNGSMRVHRRVLALESNAPLTGYKIEVFDEDITFDDLFGMVLFRSARQVRVAV
jgi:hypothetical protein